MLWHTCVPSRSLCDWSEASKRFIRCFEDILELDLNRVHPDSEEETTAMLLLLSFIGLFYVTLAMKIGSKVACYLST